MIKKTRMKKPEMTLNEFIEGANSNPAVKVARKRISTDKILLAATGRLGKERNTFKKVLFVIPPDVENDIEKYCSGSKQAIMIYLLKRGIDELKKDSVRVFFELS